MKTTSSLKHLVVIPVLLILLSGCEILIASAIISSVDIIHDRRSVGEYVDDSAIELKAKNFLLGRQATASTTRVDSTAWNGIVLLTGEIDTQKNKQDILEYVSKIQGVRQVVDETTIDDKARLKTRVNDTWITTKVKTRLVTNIRTKANRIKVKTARGTVYLMGIVTQEEADIAAEHARTVKGVQRVIMVFEYL